MSLAVVLLLVSFACFLLVDRLPGGPEVAILGPAATPEKLAQVRHDLDLDHPFAERYLRWLGHALEGDFGRSYDQGQPVSDILRRRVPATLQLVLGAQVLAVLLAVPAALAAALRPGGRLDRLVAAGSFALVTVPSFAVGLVLQFVFAERLGWLPAARYTPFGQDPLENLRTLVLPSVTLAIGQAAVYARAPGGADVDARAGLHPRGPGQGPGPQAGAAAPRAAPVVPDAGDLGGPELRSVAERVARRRAHLRRARPRRPHHRVAADPRLHQPPGRRRRAGGGLRGGELPRRPGLRRPRPPHPPAGPA